MSSPRHQADVPAFGKADLTNCEQEQIHLPGSIQPHGCMVVVAADDLKILQVSANTAEVLDVESPKPGMSLSAIDRQLGRAVSLMLEGRTPKRLPNVVQLQLGQSSRSYDVTVHSPGATGVILEFEPADDPEDLTSFVEQSFQTIVSTLTLPELFEQGARIFRELTGYDRVMVYQFDEEGHGAVVSEQRDSELEPYLGNRYPASDIPQIARRLYEYNRIRMLVDVDYKPALLEPRLSPLTSEELDMTMCSLRSVSPIHLQYLRNMGVTATLVVSLCVGGRLWGLVSCHHYKPRRASFDIRTACVVLAETFSTRIAALEGFARAEAEISIRRIEKRIIEGISREGDWKSAIFSKSDDLLRVMNASGAALSFEGRIQTGGEVPGTQEIKSLVGWLDDNYPASLFATNSLGVDVPEFAHMKHVASGLLAVPVSRAGGEYLLWFRHERIRTVTWGGNPFEPVEVGENPADLSPRRSFAKWHQLVEGTSDGWTPTDLAAARQIGESIEDVVYQFRAVRMLIAQDQLSQLTRDVRTAQQPVVVADLSGRLLLVNDAFYNLLPEDHVNLRSIEDLPELFRAPRQVRDVLEILLRDQQTWRGEVEVDSPQQGIRNLMLRADPVFVEVSRIVGYVLFFADITDRKRMELARKEFQESIVAIHRDQNPVLDSKYDVRYRNLLSSAVSNAKLAALEISDGMDFEAVPEMLDSVRDSVSVTGELLRQLLERYTRRP